jgi:hypothetical protein
MHQINSVSFITYIYSGMPEIYNHLLNGSLKRFKVSIFTDEYIKWKIILFIIITFILQ